DLAGLEPGEDPGQYGARLVARRGACDARNRVEQRLAIDGERAQRVQVGQTREVLRRIRVPSRRGRTTRDAHDAYVGAILDRHLAVRQQTHELDQEPAGHDDRTVAFDLRLERGAQRQLHVGGGEVQVPRLGAEQHTGKDLHACTCRHGTRDDTELLRELLAATDDF